MIFHVNIGQRRHIHQLTEAAPRNTSFASDNMDMGGIKCGSYRRIKLLEHAMKLVERIFEYRIWQQIDIDNMQFGFLKGNGTTDANCIVRQMREKFRAKGKLYFGSVDLEKAFGRVLRELIRWAMRKLAVKNG